MITYSFLSRYRDGHARRLDIILAPDRPTAIRKAAMRVLLDNEWLDDRLLIYDDLTAFFEATIEIVSEWTDQNGSACPNCRIGTAHEAADVWTCSDCGFTWAGHMSKARRAELEARATKLIEELDEFEQDWFS